MGEKLTVWVADIPTGPDRECQDFSRHWRVTYSLRLVLVNGTRNGV